MEELKAQQEIKTQQNTPTEIVLDGDKAKTFSGLLSAVSNLIREITFKVSPTGISFAAMDDANVCAIAGDLMVGLNIPSEERHRINLSDLIPVLKRCTGGVTLEFTDANVNVRCGQKLFVIPKLEEDKEQKIPQLAFKREVTLKTKDLGDAIDDAAYLKQDGMQFKSTGATLILHMANGPKIMTQSVTGQLHKQEVEDTIVSKFSYDYLTKIMVARKLSDSVVVKVGNDFPLGLDFKDTDVRLSYVIAPRVQND